MKTRHAKGHDLATYDAKRDFTKTAEPKGSRHAGKSKGDLSFVIQKHDATRLHYDFRLEMEGVLKSWAVPKGLPLKRGERHLAIHVEDHPMDYSDFEGTIPDGNYGAGTVMVWDRGTYSVEGDDALKALSDGKIHLDLHGEKIKGAWTLVRLRNRLGTAPGKDEWLIFKSGDDTSLKPKADDASVITGRSMSQIEKINDRQWGSNKTSAAKKPSAVVKKKSHAKKSHTPNAEAEIKLAAAFVEPMKCKLLEKPPASGDWIYEVKFDGYRALAVKTDKETKTFSRRALRLKGSYPEIEDAVQRLPCKEAILDGEIVAIGKDGKASFQLLQNAQLEQGPAPDLQYYLFDLIMLDGEDLRKKPLDQRRKLLESLLRKADPILHFSAALEGDPARILKHLQRKGLEGIVGKRSDSTYESGQRSGAWIKLKCLLAQEFVIGGYTPPQGTRTHFGALLVGFYDKGKLRFASKVGTGFNQLMLGQLNDQFQPLKRDTCPFVNLPEKPPGLTAGEMRKVTWLKPELVAQIRFSEWTADKHLRHPAFLGLRPDKAASEVVAEFPQKNLKV